MNLNSFLDELTKIADPTPPSPSKPLPINVSVRGPSIPNAGGLMKLNSAWLRKLAALGAKTLLPGASGAAMREVAGRVRDVPVLKPLRGVPSEQAVHEMMNPKPKASFNVPSAQPAPAAPPQSGIRSVAPPSARVVPNTGMMGDTIPAPAAAAVHPTIPAPARLPSMAPPMGPPQGTPTVAPAKLQKVGHQPPPQHTQEKKPEVKTDAVIAKVREKLQKTAKARPLGSRILKGLTSEAGTHKAELLGLGILAGPSADSLQAHARAAASGEYNDAGISKREVLPHVAHPVAELAGLGVLAAPSIAHLRRH